MMAFGGILAISDRRYRIHARKAKVLDEKAGSTPLKGDAV